MAMAISPLLRFGPGGDFTSEVFADRFEHLAGIQSGEAGDMCSDSNSPGMGWSAGSDEFVAGGSGVDSGESLSGADARGVGDRRDALELSSVARRAGALIVAQRILSAQSGVVRAIGMLAATLRTGPNRASISPRIVRHEPDRSADLGLVASRAGVREDDARIGVGTGQGQYSPRRGVSVRRPAQRRAAEPPRLFG